jgi:2-polyprenyl-3-methyl-5-hydroxy-6-metoxy-1,4-benzoquinol methylase
MPSDEVIHPRSVFPVSASLLDTQQAFDSVAADYDGPLGNNALIQRLRARLLNTVITRRAPGSALIDLGCGTGLDAEWLARRGYSVTATDWSPEMVKRARERADRAGLQTRMETYALGIHQLAQLPRADFDGAYSNLGPLNCAPDLESVAHALAAKLKPGGLLVASVIGRVCLWELALFGLKGQWARARLRFAPDFIPVPLNGHTVWTRYYTPREFASIFVRAGFERVSLRALSLFVPPPYMVAFAERHPRVIDALQSLEDRAGAWPLFREWGDHFLIVLQKRG